MGGIIDAIIGGVDMANLGKENEIIEFKESTAEFDKACKAIVGMLNKSGHGTIYFGVGKYNHWCARASFSPSSLCSSFSPFSASCSWFW